MTMAVDRNAERRPGGSALDRLAALLADDLAAVNRAIVARMDSPVALIPQLAGHLVAAGGKRLRPLLTLAAARLCGHAGQRHVGLAAAVEFIHTATLLHDDVVDESVLRRGRASANAMFGNKPSVLVGDFLFSRAFQVMVEDGSQEVLRILANASAVIAEGEVLQLAASNDTATAEEVYFQVIGAKTAALFAAATRIGAVVADRPAAEADALDAFGHHLGIAFQIVDDVLDYSAAEARLGKTVGDDFRDGKITLPVIIAMKRAKGDEAAFWRRTLEDGEQQEGDLDRALALLGRRGALAASMEQAVEHGKNAKQALTLFPPSPLRALLAEVVDFSIDRDY